MARELIRYLPAEGTTGIQWDDSEGTGQPIVGVRSVRVGHGEYVNSIQATYLLADKSFHPSPARGNDSARLFAAIHFVDTRVEQKREPAQNSASLMAQFRCHGTL